MAIAYAGLARRRDPEWEWLAQERMNAQAQLGNRSDALEIVVRQITKETPYPFRFWWGRIKARMMKGELAVEAYLAELTNMRAVHAQGYRLC